MFLFVVVDGEECYSRWHEERFHREREKIDSVQ